MLKFVLISTVLGVGGDNPRCEGRCRDGIGRASFGHIRHINDSKAGLGALPDNPGEVFADIKAAAALPSSVIEQGQDEMPPKSLLFSGLRPPARRSR